MLTLKHAIRYADQLSAFHGKPWIVCRTPDDAACNKHPANLGNSGRYVAIPASERPIYEAGGCTFPPQTA